MDILNSMNIQISSRYTLSSDKVTIAFSCPSTVSEMVLGLLENIGLDTWYGSVYVTSCELYKSSEDSPQEVQIRDGIASRLILVQEMVSMSLYSEM